jgi:hypothetical protein
MDMFDAECPRCHRKPTPPTVAAAPLVPGAPSAVVAGPASGLPPAPVPFINRSLRKVNGLNGQLELLEDRVRITRQGSLSSVTHGGREDKEILLALITAVEFSGPRGLTPGFIRVLYRGGQEAQRPGLKALVDENTVTFTAKQKPGFEAMREAMEQQRAIAIAEGGVEEGDIDVPPSPVRRR